MYLILLALHSLIRWFVLLSLLFAIYRAFRGWLFNKTHTGIDDSSRVAVTIAAHIQLVIGLWLYFISPIVSYFLHNFKDAVHERQIRFFGMEHITMMLTAIVLITIGSAKAKRKVADKEKFKTMAIWFTIALLLILSSIPWSFSPLISRPMLRAF
ncbi:hypothetical protein [Mucilaginibacter sp. OK098]|uniref:hypothetical protein n=1 Tax=Mucilaginibacter sp. OK098 TaxID=1855297 RepID=UPI000918BBA5|nr:hypothetical protein [Mucilaginibacter sp. OK098]SHN21649.1 hypothetical protein SAMN05216524_106538 [Mucilaginibacter sp. OK098]